MIDHAMQDVCRVCMRVQEHATRKAYVDGIPVWSHLATAAAELQERDERKWQLKRQYHLQVNQSQETNCKNPIILLQNYHSSGKSEMSSTILMR
jgi:hypothetical protein